MNRRIIILSLLAGLPFLFSAPTDAATLHVIIVGDTVGDLAAGVKNDLGKWDAEIATIQKYTGLALNKQVFTGENWKHDKVVAACKGLSVAPDDTVMFIYSGHGYHKADMKTSWPAMQFADWVRDPSGALVAKNIVGIKIDSIHELIAAKKPRLLLVIADCCNRDVPDAPVPLSTFGAAAMKRFPSRDEEARLQALLKANYRVLFLEAKGEFIASAAQPDQFAGSNAKRGGFFTERLLDTLQSATRYVEKSLDWDGIFKEVCWKPIYDSYGILQQAQIAKVSPESKRYRVLEPFITQQDLVARNLKRGDEFDEVLEDARASQLYGELENREAALVWLKKKLVVLSSHRNYPYKAAGVKTFRIPNTWKILKREKDLLRADSPDGKVVLIFMVIDVPRNEGDDEAASQKARTELSKNRIELEKKVHLQRDEQPVGAGVPNSDRGSITGLGPVEIETMLYFPHPMRNKIILITGAGTKDADEKYLEALRDILDTIQLIE